MEEGHNSLQKLAEKLLKYAPEDYEREFTYDGARTVFTTPVYQSLTAPKTDSGVKIACRLKENLSRENKELIETLQKNTANSKTCMWISDTLAVDLNLPVTTGNPFPDCSTIQILFLGEGHHFFVLTVCNTEGESAEGQAGVQEKLRDYSLVISKHLTSALCNFCCCDFYLLPCALPVSGTFKDLQKELSGQMTDALAFYDGPETLTADTYSELVTAVSAVSCVSYFPCFLWEPKGTEVWLLYLDLPWRNVVSRIIEAVVQKDTESSVTLTPETQFKLKVAVLEAAKRLGFKDRVIIFTADTDIPLSIERLFAEMEKECLQKPNMKVVLPTDVTPTADHFINIEPERIFFRCDVFRFLLVGKTGCGKSAAGNTILVAEDFEEHFSLDLGTAKCLTKTRVEQAVKLEIMDTPGLYDSSNHSPSILVEISSEVTQQFPGLDAVFYIVKIGRYTEEEYKVYLNVKAMLGEDVVKHMIVIFTFGDWLKENTIEDVLQNAPERLKEVLKACKNRYVVLNNQVKDKRSQSERVVDLVKKMKQENRGETYVCPVYTKKQRADRQKKYVQERVREMRNEHKSGRGD